MTILRLLVLLLLCSRIMPALAANYTWTGKGDGTAWSDPLNWSPTNGPPANGDSVIISSPGNKVGLSSSLSLVNVWISSAILSGGSITVTGSGYFAYATLPSVTINATTDIYPGSGADVETAIAGSFVNAATVNVHSGAEFVVNPGAQAVNQGTWTFAPQSTLLMPDQAGAVAFLNQSSLFLTNATIDTLQENVSVFSNASSGLIFCVQTNTLNGILASS